MEQAEEDKLSRLPESLIDTEIGEQISNSQEILNTAQDSKDRCETKNVLTGDGVSHTTYFSQITKYQEPCRNRALGTMETSESVENGKFCLTFSNKYVKDVISFCYYLFIRGSSAAG